MLQNYPKFRKSEVELERFYNRKIKVYSTNGQVEIRDYKKPIRTLDTRGLELVEDTKSKSLIPIRIESNKYKEIRKDSLYRTRKVLMDYTIMNEDSWQSFITLTFAENITDIDYANKEFNKFTSKIKRVFPDFKYLGVPEFQKRGAIHYHLLTNIELGSELCPLQEGKTKMYNVKYWNAGFSSAFDIVNDTDENFSVAAYMCKYLYKDLDNRLFGRMKILKSNNLKKPLEYKLSIEDENYDFIYEYMNENDIQYSSKYIECDEPYAIPFTLTKAKLSANETEEISNHLSEKE